MSNKEGGKDCLLAYLWGREEEGYLCRRGSDVEERTLGFGALGV